MKYIKVGICICNRIVELDYDATLCVREPVDNFCPTSYNVSKNYPYKSRNYKITLTTDQPRTFEYTLEIDKPNQESQVVNGSAIICSKTIPVTTGTVNYTVVDIGEGSCGDDDVDVTVTCSQDEQLETTCNCLCAGAVPTSFNSYYNWNGIAYRDQYLDSIPTYPAYIGTGFFKIENGRIYLNSICGNYAEKVIMQYKSTGVSESGLTEVPLLLKPTILAYIQWQIELNANSGLGLIETKKREFMRQKGLLVTSEIMKGILDMLKVQMSHTYVANLSR